MIGGLLRLFIAAVAVTLRWQITDPTGQLAAAPQPPLIVVFWHNRIFLMPRFYRQRWRRGHAVAAMVVDKLIRRHPKKIIKINGSSQWRCR